MTNVTSWFVDQLALPASSPKRVFSMGGSDYSSRVTRWPSVKRVAQGLQPRDVTLQLANHDGHFNFFYNLQYTIVKSATLQIGFTHVSSGDELITIYSGRLKNVKYSRETLILRLQDKFSELGTKKVGQSDVPVSLTSQIPTDIAWTLLTCYGELSNVASTNNIDINYAEFLELAAVYSGDSILCAAQYEGMAVNKALNNLAEYTDAAIWDKGDGKISFARFGEISSLDAVYQASQYTDIVPKIDDIHLINRQHVYGDYDVTSKFWKINVLDESSSSVNSYGLHENIMKFEDIWYVNSDSALNMAQRKVLIFSDPPRDIKLDMPLMGVYRDISETVRITNDFLAITSVAGFRVTEKTIFMEKGEVDFRLTNAAALESFALDVNFLDEFSAFGNQIADTLAISSAGGGYVADDVLEVSGGTSSVVAKILVEAVSTGAITSASMYAGGNYTALPSNPVGVTSQTAEFNLTWKTGGDPRLL